LNSVLVQTIMSRGAAQGLLGLELRKKTVLVTSLVLGAFIGPLGLVSALCVGHYLMLLMSIRFVARLLQTSAWSIIKAMLPGIAFSALMAFPVVLVGRLPWPTTHAELVVSVLVGFMAYWAVSALLGSSDYRFARNLILTRVQQR
jgi:hypothetical protein